MAGWTISKISSQAGLAPSAVRYYEQIGLLPRAHRVGGQRRYDSSVLNRLAVLQRARRVGFTLEEIRELLFSFPQGTRASERWQKSASAKLAQLDELAKEIEEMRSVLRRMSKNCRCETLDQCGARIREVDRGSALRKTLPKRVPRDF